ncbi:MAG: hypothetical protein ACMXYA_01665 [Candidatus Woesearchaeota archaeon]
MAEKKYSAKEYGARYGAKNREKIGAIKQSYKKKSMKDPITNKKGGVKRVSAGIFISTKTGKKFTARAYSPQRSVKAIEDEE